MAQANLPFCTQLIKCNIILMPREPLQPSDPLAKLTSCLGCADESSSPTAAGDIQPTRASCTAACAKIVSALGNLTGPFIEHRNPVVCSSQIPFGLAAAYVEAAIPEILFFGLFQLLRM